MILFHGHNTQQKLNKSNTMGIRKLWYAFPVKYCKKCGNKLYESNINKKLLVCHKCNTTQKAINKQS